MNILILGCGGRENILAQKLSCNKNKINCIGGWINPDIYSICHSYNIIDLNNNKNEQNIMDIVSKLNPEMIVIGPETVLNTNMVSRWNSNKYICIAPVKELAKLEISKGFTRDILKNNDLSNFNPSYLKLESSITNIISPSLIDELKNFDKIVVKVDGLYGGKGVFVQDDHFNTFQEGINIAQNLSNNNDLIIEEKLEGDEYSLFTLSDGKSFFHFPPVQDYKRAYDNNKGPNTGGMGSIMRKFDFLDELDIETSEKLNERVIQIMQDKYKYPYKGVLYGRFMKTKTNKIKLIEFNCRFGDSEIFNILNSIETDLSLIFKNILNTTLNKIDIKLKNKVNIVKYLVPKGYPTKSILKNINYNKNKNIYSASINENNLLLGSRSLAVYAEGDDLNEAYIMCENLISSIDTKDLFWRKDIGKLEFSYERSGVDINKGEEFVNLIKKSVESTYNSNVLGKHGNFGGQFKFNNKVLVASTDGVGTKSILIKKYTNSYYTCGFDIVNHSVNDILVQGAKPLFFLDYVASSKLNLDDLSSFVFGCCDACKSVGCVLLGGETAEMPLVYNENHIDMVGTIVGEKFIEMEGVSEGDLVLGLPSSGPQTNGYSLIRSIIEKSLPSNDILEKFLEPHSSFLNDVIEINKNYIITGMCHITGGGLTNNLKRIIPSDCFVDLENIVYPDWCNWLKEKGNLSDEEMRKVFNCGIGYIVFVKPRKTKNKKKINIGILGSTNGTDLDSIVNNIYFEESPIFNKAEIKVIISDNKNSGILKKGRNYNLSTIHLKKSKDQTREEYDKNITNILEACDVDLVLCIGWMRILSEQFVNRWKNKCFNVHPSLLPLYAGGMDNDVHTEVLKDRCKETGCTIHEITNEVDKGKIILQLKCDVKEDDTPITLKNRVQKLEQEALCKTIYMFLENDMDCKAINSMNSSDSTDVIDLGFVKRFIEDESIEK